MRVAVDAMGGDFAPRAVVDGAVRAAAEDATEILLVGPVAELEPRLRAAGDAGGTIEIVDAPEVVGMDEAPATALRRKRRSSVQLCAELVRDGRAHAMVSCGNTGAALIAAKMVVGMLPGVDRPALAAVFPNRRSRTVVLDVGANIDARLGHLRQFAVMGHFYAQELLGEEAPRVGLLSVGEEREKGTEKVRRLHRVLEQTGLNFVGNVEGRDVFRGTVDVVVCDGFVGNVLLKSAESLAELFIGMLREELSRSWRSRLGYLVARPALARLKLRTDYRETGAAPLLGVDGGCFVGHGRSNARAVRNAIRQAADFCAADLHGKIRLKVALLHDREKLLLEEAAPEEARAR